MKTFHELRVQYLKKNPPPALLDDVYLSQKLTKSEFIKELNAKGVDISARTLTYYINQKIINKPSIGAKKAGKGKESYFLPADIERILLLKTLQAKGYSLAEVKDKALDYQDLKKFKETNTAESEFKYFFALSNILINNLPEDVSNYSLKKYLSFICLNPELENQILAYLKNSVAEINPIRKSMEEALEKCKFRNPKSYFDVLFYEIWSARLRALYYEFTRSLDPKEFMKVAFLYTSFLRMTIILIYANTIIQTCRSITNALLASLGYEIDDLNESSGLDDHFEWEDKLVKIAEKADVLFE